MSRKRNILLWVLSLFCFMAFSEPDNGEFLPDPEVFQLNHMFFEAGGGLSFPMEFFSQGHLAMTDFGYTLFANMGYNWSGWFFVLAYSRDRWGQGHGDFALMENFMTNVVEFRVQKIISHKMWDKIPSWLKIIPGLGLGVNFITTDYYPSLRAKEEGRLVSIKLGDPSTSCLFYRATLENAFFFGTDMVIPFIGIDYNAFYDVSIGGGFAGYARAYAGLRVYPLGIINDIKEKHQREEEERMIREFEEMVASWPEPEAHLKADPNTDFTPDGDSLADMALLLPSARYLEYPPEKWSLVIYDPQHRPFKVWEGHGSLPMDLTWNGKSNNGELVFSRNRYTAELTLVLDEHDSERTGKVSLTARDTIDTGILFEEIIPNKQWRVIVNTIYFDPDKATFDRISPAQRKENRETLDSLARQIKMHGSVKVSVEGYANNVTNTERENRVELIPLSALRAKTIMDMLIQRGLDKNMLSSVGRGGANPIAEWKDRENWWKNRRVEFIVTKIDE